MEMPRFSLVVWLRDTKEMFFRDFLESMVSQNYDAWELYVMDANDGHGFGTIMSEFFPEDDRVHYRQLKNKKGKAYAYNIGLHFVLTNEARLPMSKQESGYLYFVGQHDRLSPDALSRMALSISEAESRPQVVYTDHDRLVGVDRMEPHFKPAFNKELLLHRNYIGAYFAVSCLLARKLGEFQESLTWAPAYDYLLRAMEAGASFERIPALLYHERQLPAPDKKAERMQQEQSLKEHMLVAQASLKRRGIAAEVTQAPDPSYWRIDYHGSDAYGHQREYMLLRDPGVRPMSRHNVERMYGYLRQKDVAVVGARFIKHGFLMEQCGYLYDSDGSIYPAFYDQKIYRPTYEQMASIPRDVSMVDFRYCMIDAKVYRKLQGLDATLSGREQMLDFCLRARVAGYRVVVEPAVLVRSPGKDDESTRSSHEVLLDKWQEVLAKGDPSYNPNLPMGLNNYRL